MPVFFFFFYVIWLIGGPRGSLYNTANLNILFHCSCFDQERLINVTWLRFVCVFYLDIIELSVSPILNPTTSLLEPIWSLMTENYDLVKILDFWNLDVCHYPSRKKQWVTLRKSPQWNYVFFSEWVERKLIISVCIYRVIRNGSAQRTPLTGVITMKLSSVVKGNI